MRRRTSAGRLRSEPERSHHGRAKCETVEESGRIRGDDVHKCVKGRKRYLLVDTLGLPLSFYVMPANVHDTGGARWLLAGLKYFVPHLKIIWADQANQGHNLADWSTSTGDWKLEVVKRPLDTHGWSQQPIRWILERMFAWLLRNRRLSGEPVGMVAALLRQ